MVSQTTGEPADALAAVTHPDPYPYYARLVRETPVTFDPVHRLWIVAGAATVVEVLSHPLCRVRPAEEPVPRALIGGPLGEVYGRFARMNDGPAHAAHRNPVAAVLEPLEIATVEIVAADCAHAVMSAPTWRPDGAGATQAAFEIPVRTMAALLDIPVGMLRAATDATHAVVRALRPSASDAQRSAGREAVRRLRSALTTTSATELDAAAEGAAVGILVQTCDATAGLIGNTLLCLSRHPSAQRAVVSEPQSLLHIVNEVARFDPPVQNTRRYLAEPASIGGVRMERGAVILVLLAAANRDPAANPMPSTFDWTRQVSALFTFGVGAHACPGRLLAVTIAASAVGMLLSAGVDVHRLAQAFAYQASINTRIPLFAPFGDC